jgi:hypothetical protein
MPRSPTALHCVEVNRRLYRIVDLCTSPDKVGTTVVKPIPISLPEGHLTFSISNPNCLDWHAALIDFALN